MSYGGVTRSKPSLKIYTNCCHVPAAATLMLSIVVLFVAHTRPGYSDPESRAQRRRRHVAHERSCSARVWRTFEFHERSRSGCVPVNNQCISSGYRCICGIHRRMRRRSTYASSTLIGVATRKSNIRTRARSSHAYEFESLPPRFSHETSCSLQLLRVRLKLGEPRVGICRCGLKRRRWG